MINNLNIARYRLEFVAETPLTLPAFAGSTLRGAFGHALRKSVCVTKAKECEGCQVLSNCTYVNIFEPRPSATHVIQDFNQIPRPYVIEPPEWGEKTYLPHETLSFHLVLAGHAVAQLALILWAFNQAFQQGIGKTNGKAKLLRVSHVNLTDEQVVLEGLASKIMPHETQIQPYVADEKHEAILQFRSPLRLQTNGRRATAEEFTARKLLMLLVKRIALIHEFHGGQVLDLDFKAMSMLAEKIESEKQLKWRDWSRYSSRQQQKIDLGGVVGSWKLSGDIQPFLPFLHLGQWLHVGKEAAFGLGGYTLELL